MITFIQKHPSSSPTTMRHFILQSALSFPNKPSDLKSHRPTVSPTYPNHLLGTFPCSKSPAMPISPYLNRFTVRQDRCLVLEHSEASQTLGGGGCGCGCGSDSMMVVVVVCLILPPFWLCVSIQGWEIPIHPRWTSKKAVDTPEKSRSFICPFFTEVSTEAPSMHRLGSVLISICFLFDWIIARKEIKKSKWQGKAPWNKDRYIVFTVLYGI